MSDESRISITQLRTVGVPVTDQDRALAFYTGSLGFEKRIDVSVGADLRWIEIAPSGSDGASIALIRATEGVPAGVETGIRLMTPDADRTHAGMLAAGIHADEVLRWPDAPPMFAFRDPDGNGLEVVEDE